jgi:hypothetical protein
MKTLLKILGGVLLVAIVAYGGWRVYQSQRARKAGLLTENISHQGDTWQANFTARLPAREDSVFSTIQNIEFTHNDQIKAVRVVSRKGNTKIVDMDINAPGGQTITTQLEFEYLPEQKKIIYHTVNNPLLDTQAEYQLQDEGSSTLIDYHETTKMLQQVPVPDGVIKQVIRGVFIAQLESLKHSLNITTAEQADPRDEEP